MTISKETKSLDVPWEKEYGYSQEFHMSEEDLQLLITLDDPWNARECDTFYNRQAENTVAYWPGRGDTTIEQKPLSKTFPDSHIDNAPYRMTLDQGD